MTQPKGLENQPDADGPSFAADDPTDVWDEEMLRAAGLVPELEPSTRGEPPSVPIEITDEEPSGIEISPDVFVPSSVEHTERRARPTMDLSWPLTLALALALAAAAYFGVRFLQ